MLKTPNPQIKIDKIPLMMGEVNLERMSEFEYLGVIVGENFTWQPHINC